MSRAQHRPAYVVREGEAPLILAQPHAGLQLLPGMEGQLSETGRSLADTDWHVDRLYADLLPGVTVLRATYSRVAIDCNRDPEGISLYPGQNTTQLCPVVDFEGRRLYRDAAAEPTPEVIAKRREAIHRRYHQTLRSQIRRLRRRHPHVLLFDCHSIRSQLPYLFEGTLPLVNLGTFNGKTCHPSIERTAARFCSETFSEDEWVLNGRFKGGYTVRHHAAPEQGVHCFQLELAQRAYLDTETPPWHFSEDKAGTLRPLLAQLLSRLLEALGDLEPAALASSLAPSSNRSGIWGGERNVDID